MLRIVHFEIPADDPDRAVDFYTKVFGWEISKWEGPIDYWLVKTGETGQPGIDGGIVQREENATICNTLDVPSLDDFIDKIEKAGGKVVQPKTTVAGVGYMAYCADTEGNVFGMMQEDPNAA